MDNTVKVWDFANSLTRMLRRTEEAMDDLTTNTRSEEIDYKDRLIEIFGYPYSADIGGGGTYPEEYDGPDLYHYMVVDAPQLKGTPLDIEDVGTPPAQKVTTFTAGYGPMANGVNFFDIDSSSLAGLNCGSDPFGDGCSLGDPIENNSHCTGGAGSCCTAGAGPARPVDPTYAMWTDPTSASPSTAQSWGASERRAVALQGGPLRAAAAAHRQKRRSRRPRTLRQHRTWSAPSAPASTSSVRS